MKNLLLIVLFVFSQNLSSQDKKAIYVDDQEDYVILLDKNIKINSKNVNGTEVDIFAKSSKDKFNYTLLISKIFEHNFTKGNLLDLGNGSN